MSHQAYGPRTAVPRLLRLLDRHAVRATFFVPGYTAERWPAICPVDPRCRPRDRPPRLPARGRPSAPARRSRSGGCSAASRRSTRSLGVRPIGYRGPNWELTTELAGAARPARLRVRLRPDGRRPPVLPRDGPRARRADPGRAARPLALDDWEPYNYLPGITGSGVIASPADVIARWTLELEALVEEGGLFMLTNHPFVSGRASRAAALGRLIERARAIDGLWIATCDEIAAHVATLDLEPVVHQPPGRSRLSRPEPDGTAPAVGRGGDDREMAWASAVGAARQSIAALEDPIDARRRR